MIDQSVSAEIALAERALLRGTVTDIDDDCRFSVAFEHGGEERRILADLIMTSDTPLRLEVGDSVVCWVDSDDAEQGLILGRIGSATVPAREVVALEEGRSVPNDVPDTLVLEAKESLTLRVGDGSITIRADGKILIKGKDLVSHAKNVNRIKGGAVAIN